MKLSTLTFASLLPLACWAQDSLEVPLAGELLMDWQTANGIVLNENYAYLTTGESGLAVLDISDKQRPQLCCQVKLGGWTCHGLLDDGYLYLACGDSGIRILDVTNPVEPVEVGHCGGIGNVVSLDKAGEALYAAAWQFGLQIISVQNPENPEVIGSYRTPGIARDVKISGTYAYVACHTAGLLVFDVSDPTRPALVSELLTRNYASHVALNDRNFAYVVEERSGLRIVDVTDPLNPLTVGSYRQDGWNYSIETAGDVAYFGYNGGLMLFDMSDPVFPRIVDNYRGVHPVFDLVFSEGVLYAACFDEGMHIFDASDPDTLRPTGSITYNSVPHSIIIEGSLAYISASFHNFVIVDIRDPDNMHQVGEYKGVKEVYELDVYRSHAYMLSSWDSIVVVDASDPASPRIVRRILLPGKYIRDLEIGDNFLYTSWADGLRIYDLTNPDRPSLAGALTDSDFGWIVAIDGNTLLMYTEVEDEWGNGAFWYFTLIDVADKANPRLIKRIDLDDHTFYFAFNGGMIYLKTSGQGMKILDPNPDEPQVIAEYNSYANLKCGQFDDRYLYLMDDNAGLRILDMSDLQRPIEVGQNRSVSSYYFDIHSRILYVSNRYYLQAYDCSGRVNVEKSEESVVRSFALLYAYPNPFNSSTTITFSIPVEQVSEPVHLAIYDHSGRLVADLTEAHPSLVPPASGGEIRKVVWNASGLAAGVYIVRLQAGNRAVSQKVVLMR